MNEKYVLDLKFLVEFSSNLLYISNYEKVSSLLNNSLIRIIINIAKLYIIIYVQKNLLIKKFFY